MKDKSNFLLAFDENIKSKFSYLPSLLSNATVIHKNNVLLIDSGLNTDMFNILCCEGIPIRENIRLGIQYFKDKNLPYSFWVGFEQDPIWLKEELYQLGLISVEKEWAMACDSMQSDWSEFQDIPFAVRRVTSVEILQDFITVIQALLPYHEHAAIETLYLKSAHALLSEKSSLTCFVGYDNGRPIATSSVFFHSGLASIFDVIVLPKMRGRGLGKWMTLQAMNQAKEKGVDICILTATNDARYLYEKLGFKVVKAMEVYNERPDFRA